MLITSVIDIDYTYAIDIAYPLVTCIGELGKTFIICVANVRVIVTSVTSIILVSSASIPGKGLVLG